MSLTGASSLDLGKRLLEASREGNVGEVTDLMATGAPLTSDWLGTSPLHLAAQCGHTETAQILLSAGISRNGTTKVEKTPLHLAAQHGNFDIVKLLVANGALIDACDMLNMTPLHWACEGGYEDIADVLLKAGAKVNIRSKFGKTAEDIAIRKGYNDIVLKLLSDYDITATPIQGADVNVYEVKKRARARKFPMTAGSWAAGDQGRSDRTPNARHGNKKRRSESTPNDQEIDGSNSPENNLSSLVSAAAMVRSKNEELPGNRGRASETSERDSSVLETLATLATASTQVNLINRNASTYGSPVSMGVSTAVPNFITIPSFQNQMTMSHPSAVNLVNHPQLTANLPANVVGNLQMASPFSLNIVPSVGGQPRLQLGSNQTMNNVQHITLPINMHPSPTQAGTIMSGNNTPTLQPNIATGTTLSIVGGIPTSTSPYMHSFAAAQAGQPCMQGHTVAMSPQGQSCIPQGSIPVNIPISLFNSMLTNAMATSVENQQVVSSNPTNTTAPISIQPATSVQQTHAVGTPNQEIPNVQYIPVAGPGGVQLIPNHAYLQSQLMSALRGAITPGYGQVPVVQQPGVYSPGTLTFPLNPINLSNILPTALSMTQLPIPATQMQVTTVSPTTNVSVHLSNKELVSSVTPVMATQQKPILKSADVIPIQPHPGDSSSSNQQIIPKLQQLYQNYFSNTEDMPKAAAATTTTLLPTSNEPQVSTSTEETSGSLVSAIEENQTAAPVEQSITSNAEDNKELSLNDHDDEKMESDDVNIEVDSKDNSDGMEGSDVTPEVTNDGADVIDSEKDTASETLDNGDGKDKNIEKVVTETTEDS